MSSLLQAKSLSAVRDCGTIVNKILKQLSGAVTATPRAAKGAAGIVSTCFCEAEVRVRCALYETLVVVNGADGVVGLRVIVRRESEGRRRAFFSHVMTVLVGY
jgi:hypothetical protein